MAKKQSDPEYIFETESTVFANRLDMKYRKERAAQDGSQLEDQITIHLDKEGCRRGRFGQEDHTSISGHIKFEMSIRQPHEDTEQAVGYANNSGDRNGTVIES